jgi:UTP--glucose-1-phosphate uridylyltransferase
MLVEPAPERDGALPFVDLEKRFYGLIEPFERRFPSGAPSLREADRFVVRGDVTFGSGVVVRGSVELDAAGPLRIDDGAVLGG